ncbi:Arabinanase/levansucrase/invertase [Microthyrium microscopicum]|uniref:Arabinanase/levansucrase/invertase n=1 Tax=Microthyrium microscopicum TaxID=703497 RepID=A0A6A6UHS1_9PEZI|nr:Arabinanase/levansucrase/invertase [Microthyrium microscopicum]
MTISPKFKHHPLDLRCASLQAWTLEGSAFGSGPIENLGLEAGFPLGMPVISSHGKPSNTSGVARSDAFVVTAQYLDLLISGGDHEFTTCIKLLVDGKVVANDTGRRSAAAHPTTLDLSAWIGRLVQVEIVDKSNVAEPNRDWSWIRIGGMRMVSTPAVPICRQPLYREALRPRVHFTARQWTMCRNEPGHRQEGWLNDLNGLVWFDGEYHLFAQRWNKCWIHAVSTNLVHWTELEPAFFEEGLETGVQSGSCVVDYNNSSGLGDGKTPPMVAFWSRNDNRSQCMSYSLDHGRTWTHWKDNPLMVIPERDPMVFRDHRRKRWTMVLYGESRYHFLISDNLLHWEVTGQIINDSFECPDFFELRINGVKETKWVLVRGNGHYSIGTFDGLGFKEETGQLQPDVGNNFYATQSWAAGTGIAPRRIQVAWVQGSRFPQMPFNQQVSIPCDLTLRRTAQGLRLFRTPIPELVSLETREHIWVDHKMKDGEVWGIGTRYSAFRLRATFKAEITTELELRLSGSTIVIAGSKFHGSVGSGTVSVPISEVDIIVDIASIELFVNGGELSATTSNFAGQPDVVLTAHSGNVLIEHIRITELKSIWTGE